MGTLFYWLAVSALLYLTALIVPGFKITSFPRAMVAALIIGFLNAFVKPVLFFLTLPFTIITLGLFIFVVNAIVLRLAAGLLKGFDINGWTPAIIGAFVLAVLRVLAFSFFVV